MNKNLFELIEELLSLLRLDRNSVEKVTGSQLWSPNEQNHISVHYVGITTLATADTISIELRAPGPWSECKDGFLILSDIQGLNITRKEIYAHFGRQSEWLFRDLCAPKSVPNYLVYYIKGTKLSFGILEPAPDTLVEVVLDRTGF